MLPLPEIKVKTRIVHGCFGEGWGVKHRSPLKCACSCEVWKRVKVSFLSVMVWNPRETARSFVLGDEWVFGCIHVPSHSSWLRLIAFVRASFMHVYVAHTLVWVHLFLGWEKHAYFMHKGHTCPRAYMALFHKSFLKNICTHRGSNSWPLFRIYLGLFSHIIFHLPYRGYIAFFVWF